MTGRLPCQLATWLAWTSSDFILVKPEPEFEPCLKEKKSAAVEAAALVKTYWISKD
jgi:hypothetical protein